MVSIHVAVLATMLIAKTVCQVSGACIRLIGEQRAHMKDEGPCAFVAAARTVRSDTAVLRSCSRLSGDAESHATHIAPSYYAKMSFREPVLHGVFHSTLLRVAGP